MVTAPASGADPSPMPPAIDVGQVMAAVVNTDLPKHSDGGEHVNESVKPSVRVTDLHPRTKEGFLHIFGWMGVPMVIIFLMSAAWTFALAVIQQTPGYIANWLMDTEDLDYGDFWLLPKPGLELSVPAIILLVLFGLGYVGLVVLMAFPDKLLRSRWSQPHDHSAPHTSKPDSTIPGLPTKMQLHSIASATHVGRPESEPKVTPAGEELSKDSAKMKQVAHHSSKVPPGLSWERVKYEWRSPEGLLHQYYNPIVDLPKLIFQTATLFTYLRNGFPLAIVYIYTCALFVNWMISAYRYKRERPDPHYVASRIFYSFDLFFAVFAPLEVLCYAYYTFHFDRDEFATRVAMLNTGSFDRTARLFADPKEVSMFRIAFHYLQFTTTDSLLVKSALNLLSLFKWWNTIIHLVDHARALPKTRGSVHLRSFERVALVKIRRRKYLQNLMIAGLFFCAGTAMFIYSIVAVESSHQVCKAHPQCKVPRYQWNVGEKHCSCIVFVDREAAPKTIEEWESPPDTSAHLAALATTGHLRIVQIINRELAVLPDELRKCHDLEQLILIYTKTRMIPDWAKEFKHLEYLHIEGDLTAKQLTYMPRDLFAKMPHLLFLHLGSLVKLPYVPDLDNLKHLQYLVLAMLHSVTALPSLLSLHDLKRLNILDAIQLPVLPPVHGLVKLKQFALTSRNPVCCNGFITGTCDLTDFSCLDRTASGEPLVQCTVERIAPEDYKVLVDTEGVVCEQGITSDLKNVKPTYASTNGACGGVKYKQCTLNGAAGMCYPARMQPISCQVTPGYQSMRRLQIKRGVGERCDPVIEKWLGCEV